MFAFVFGMVLGLMGLNQIFSLYDNKFGGILLFLIYYINLEAFWGGRTIGKLITGTKVVNINGNKINFFQAVGRSIIRLIPIDPISYLHWNGKLNGMHDRLTRTVVISMRNKTEKFSI